MIRFLRGKIIEKGDANVVIEVDDGIGYMVLISPDCELWGNAEMDEELELFTSHQFRENEQSLYGFSSLEERNFFEQLITVSGVGPKLAAALLAHVDRRELAEMIVNDDIAGIVAVPGIGKKMAERIIVDLRDRVLGGEDVERKVKKGDYEEEMGFLAQALERLGFSSKEREEMLRGVEKYFDSEASVEDVLKRLLAEAER